MAAREDTINLGLPPGSRALVIVAVVAGIASSACTALVLALVQRALAGAAADVSLVAAFTAGCIGVLTSQAICRVLLVRVGQDLMLRLRLDVARRVIAAPLARVEERGPHRLLSALTEDVLAVADAVPEVQTVFAQATIAVGCFAFIAWTSWPLALALAGLAAAGTLTYLLPLRIALAALRRARSWQDRVFADLEALIRGLKELKLHGGRRRAFLDEGLRASAEGFRRETTLGMSVFMVGASWGQTQYLVGIGLLLFVAPSVLEIPPGGLAGVIVAVLYLAVPIDLMLSAAPVLGRGATALRNLRELDLGNDSTEHPRTDSEPAGAWREITLSRVAFRHPAQGDAKPFEVGPVDLTLHPGEVVFLIGGNGSGKTTLAKVLTGLYTPSEGEVSVDGEPVTDATREQHRQRFSAVFADSHLFDRLHGLSRELERADELLRFLALDHKVSLHEGAFSTTALSRGQRRRLMLLVAQLENRDVYVFDEWAADQDPAFRTLFYTQVLDKLRAAGKCVLVVSHDDRFFDAADRVLRLEDGQLVSAEASRAH